MSKTSNPRCRLVGDIHGNTDYYKKIISKSPFSLQVGDFFSYNSGVDSERHKFIGGNHEDYRMKLREDLTSTDVTGDSNYTLACDGGPFGFVERYESYELNHDDPKVYEFNNLGPQSLGSYGIWDINDSFNDSIFYVRGAWSVDGSYRRTTDLNSWFPREQISEYEGRKVLELYEKEKPAVVVTHDCPYIILDDIYLPFSAGPKNTSTGRLFDIMLQIWRPRLWVFGHHHQRLNTNYKNTNFICLNKAPNDGNYIDLNKNLEII